MVRAYTVGNNKNKGYARILPLCDKCKLHHHGPCPIKCGNYKKVGHQAKDYWTPTTVTCYGCRGKGHTKRCCPELGNQNGDREARQNLDIVIAYEANQNNQNGDGNPHVSSKGVMPVAHECTYQEFMKCQLLNFKGTEGVVGLTRWYEKMETVFHISNCLQKCQVKYASCTLQDSALIWWNSQKRTFGTDAAYAMTWKALIKLMTEV
nr:reverse transcriptase domain-containing protein [Tanacetum cinerariifolium]